MDERIKAIIDTKIKECMDDIARVNAIASALSKDKHDALMLGIIIGRVYNSFYYQYRRILGRDPNDEEFKEFLELLKDRLGKSIK